MSVTVSLEQLVSIRSTRPLWPDDFNSLVLAIEENLNDKTPWGVIADWCQEHGEEGLAEAFRWVHKRPAVEISRENYTPFLWDFVGLPTPVAAVNIYDDFDRTTIPGAVAKLAARLQKLKEVMA